MSFSLDGRRTVVLAGAPHPPHCSGIAHVAEYVEGTRTGFAFAAVL